jgi:hypothetical protein
MKTFFTSGNPFSPLRFLSLSKSHGLGRKSFPTLETWNKANPLDVVRQLPAEIRAQFPSIYLSCGKKDEFGYYNANAAIANGLSLNNDWQPLNCGHFGPYDLQAIAQFFERQE